MKKYYLQFGGDMKSVMKYVEYATSKDRYRFKIIIDKMIEAGELKVRCLC